MKLAFKGALTLACIAAASVSFSQNYEVVQGEILVKFRGATYSAASRFAQVANMAIGARTVSTVPVLKVDRVQIPRGMSVDDALYYYGGLSTVEYAEPNSKKELFHTPNDPQFATQYAQKKVKCPEAWDLTKGAATVVVAVIDTGVDKNHEDLKNKLVQGYDFSDNDNDPTYNGDHGVHVCGIVGAETNNGIGVAGTGYNVKVMPLKIFPNSTDANSAAAIIYAADHGAKVINMSYGSGFESITERNAVNYAWSKGLVIVAASGNDGSTQKFYPAAHVNCIAVGSTGQTDTRSGFSNYGTDWVDVGAPGENVLSTIPGGYGGNTGTSMASPVCAGVVALLWSFAAPGTTNTQIRQALESTTDPISNGGFANGRINAFKALQLLDPGSATISPVTSIATWFGTNGIGSASDVNASDSAFFEVTSTLDVLGQLAGAQMTMSMNGPSSGLREAKMIIEANGPTAAAGQLYLWNYTTNKFELMSAFRLAESGKNTQRIKLKTNLSAYVSGGNLQVGIRAIGPSRGPGRPTPGPFTLKIGLVQLETRPQS